MLVHTHEPPRKHIIKFIFYNCSVGLTLCSRDKGILVITHIQKETAEAWALSQSASSSPWNKLPAIVKDRHIFLSRVKTHLFRALFGPPQLPPQQLFLSLYFPFLFTTFIRHSLPWHCPLISYPVSTVCRQTQKIHPCYQDLLGMYLLVSYFYPDFWVSELMAHKHSSYLTLAENKSP